MPRTFFTREKHWLEIAGKAVNDMNEMLEEYTNTKKKYNIVANDKGVWFLTYGTEVLMNETNVSLFAHKVVAFRLGLSYGVGLMLASQ